MKRRFLVPEVIQTSAMDCGPAALKALLEGHGIHASYGRLREACQTGVDGTSIDALEQAAVDLGLTAEQIMVPVDHLLSSVAPVLPALVIVRLPSGLTHFVVLWRKHGSGLLQVMDPASGRRWIRNDQFLAEVYRHTQPVPVDAWKEWASGDAFLGPLRARMRRTGHAASDLVKQAAAGTYRDLARLDAATRMVEGLIACGALRGGASASRLLTKLARGEQPVPDQYWSAVPHPEDPELVLVRGAVLLHVRGRAESAAAPASPELAAALREKPARPLLEMLRIIRASAGLAPLSIAAALAAAALGTILEALLLRGLLDIGRELTISGQRMSALAALLGLSALLLALDFSNAGKVFRLGRTIETAIRVRFLAKLPRLSDRYFQSRPISDMASRSHQVQLLRNAPQLAAAFLRAVFEMLMTTAGIMWLYPEAAAPAVLLAAACAGIPLAAQPALAERDLRMRSHSGALTQFYLDALLGLTAIRVHGAEAAVRKAQDSLLASWASAALSVHRLVAAVEGVQMTAAFSLAAWIVWSQLQPGGDVGGLLLLVYWVLNLPSLGREAASAAWQYPAQRNTTLRILEPLGAPEEAAAAENKPQSMPSTGGVEIRLESVTVRAGGHVILKEVDLSIPAGSHVAIVGASGAGKSSLAGLLLGWHQPEQGRVLVDGGPLDAAGLRRLRGETAWIDPQVQLWNRSLFGNLTYGAPQGVEAGMNGILDDADLRPVLEKLPEGFQTELGEGGALVSGGEGQRVRIGRAMGRPDSRLAILDEPARGLDCERRRAVLDTARERWRNATLLAITHDIRDTRGFERVLVIGDGRVVEDGSPAELASRPDSLYRRLLDAEEDVRRGLWSSGNWRRISIENGRIVERESRRDHVTASY